LPTFAESGITGAEAVSWFALLAPAATPRDIVNRLHAETVKVLRLPDVRQRFETEGAEPVGNTPEETTAFIRDEISKWTRVIKDAGIKLE
jgi:tripartite-type tricarboxylate transporter receptor subunit TctC